MSTWHQDRAGNNRPIPHLYLWGVFTNPQNDMCSSMLFSTQADARTHLRKIVEHSGQLKRPQLVPPIYLDVIRQLETAQADACELDELVHEMKAAEAASINNGGLREQIEYLATQFKDAREFVGHLNDMKLGKFKIEGYD